MNKTLTAVLLSLMICVGLPAYSTEQPKGPDHKKFNKELREFKYKFLAQEMQLADDQQQRFFELYAQMSSEKRKNRAEVWRMQKNVMAKKPATDAEYVKLYEAMSAGKIADGQIERKYDEKFKTFLTPVQICKMKIAEQRFHKKLMDMCPGKGSHKGK